jgi:integrase
MGQGSKSRPQATAPTASSPPTLATVHNALDHPHGLSATRLRDLRSGVSCVAELLGNEPSAIELSLEKIQACLASVNPAAVGMTSKRFTNIRSDFLAAVRASGVIPIKLDSKAALSSEWSDLLGGLSKRHQLGLLRLARHLSNQGIRPGEMKDKVIAEFIVAVREGSLHKQPKVLHRKVTQIWNEVGALKGLPEVTVPSFRPPAKRIKEALLPRSFLEDRDNYLAWCAVSDQFAVDARDKPLAPRTLKLTKNQIHAAVSALVKSGVKTESVQSLADLVTVENMKSILRQRLADAGGQKKSFDHYLARALVRIAKESVKVDGDVLEMLKKAANKLPAPSQKDLTPKNHVFIRQFDDPATLRRLRSEPEKLWKEVKEETSRKPNFRSLAKAQAALALALPLYMPIRPDNVWKLEFDKHIFLRSGPGAKSTLAVSEDEVKNETPIGFDIPEHLVKMLLDYRDRIAPAHIGHRPKRLFVHLDGTPKAQSTIAYLIKTYAKNRVGITMTPHQFRHLAAKTILDANPGNYRGVQDALTHKSLNTTRVYAGLNTRRAGRHHQYLIDQAVARQMPPSRRRRRKGENA